MNTQTDSISPYEVNQVARIIASQIAKWVANSMTPEQVKTVLDKKHAADEAQRDYNSTIQDVARQLQH